MNTIWSITILVNLLLGITGASDNEGCHSPHYLEVGSKGTIICSFQEGFLSVYWYNSRDYVLEQAVVEYKDSVKRGDGITSGEFDIYTNGSLIINNVTFGHDHYFTAIKLNSVLDDYDPHYIRVIVTVSPAYRYPVIEQCGPERTFCFQKISSDSDLNCFVQNTRPGVTLEWLTRTEDSDRNVTFDFSTQARAELTSSNATTTDAFAYTSGLSLLVCKAEASPGLLDEYESLIIVQSASLDLLSLKPISISIQINSRLELKCAESKITYLVWKYKHADYNEFQEILYAVVVRDNLTIMKDGYELKLGESLVIPSVQIKNEGLYGCIYGNGTFDGMTAYDLIVYVPPVPAYPVVEGCSHGQYCVLEVKREGSVTCTVKGIRPKVKLIWKLRHASSTTVFFKTQETTVTRNDDSTFDVSLTSQYEAEDLSQPKVTIECTMSETDIEMIHLTTILDLLFVTEVYKPTGSNVVLTKKADQQGISTSLVIVPVVIAIIALILVICGSVMIRAKCMRPPTMEDKDADKPMIPLNVSKNPPSEINYEAKKQTFVTELKAKYEDLCEAIHPVPYIRDKIFSVNKVFVEGGFEFMDPCKKWKSLESHYDILTDSNVRSQRRIIEGKAGYGKSTLALQFAYEWCYSTAESPLINKEIFILLRLRQLGGVDTVYRAIKQFLLPKDSRLNEDDICNILQLSSSVVVFLDGFDEYPDDMRANNSFVINIINRQIFQQFEVILTTRSGCLPTDFAPQTKRIRLTGFHNEAQEAYLQQAVIGDDVEAAEKVKEALQQNPFLDDICRAPLFFVLFAHMCADEERIPKFSSVTPFFRHIISCLHSHRENKLKDDNVRRYNQMCKASQTEFNKIAFDGLCKNKELVWQKESFLEKLGEEFYTHYVSIGVLLEERVICFNDDPGTPISEHVQHRIDVTFYHKLFCEWYAAHFLAEHAAKPEVKLDPRDEEDNRNRHTDVDTPNTKLSLIDQTSENDNVNLQHLDPADVQYAYRFACGLNPNAAEKIYQYLKSRQGGDKFALLCLLEQTGKFENIKRTIEKMCESTITIYGSHKKLHQNSIIQHLEIASRQEIPITHLWINNCFESIDYTWKQIVLTSGSKIPKLHTLQALDIRENGKEMTKKETEAIFNYCIWCADLKAVKFVYCLMPQSIPTDSFDFLRKRNMKVLWDTDFTSLFKLNLSSGCWQHEDGGVRMTEEEYKDQMDAFQRLKRTDDSKGQSNNGT